MFNKRRRSLFKKANELTLSEWVVSTDLSAMESPHLLQILTCQGEVEQTKSASHLIRSIGIIKRADATRLF